MKNWTTPFKKLMALTRHRLPSLLHSFQKQTSTAKQAAPLPGEIFKPYNACIKHKIRNDRKKILHVISGFGISGSAMQVVHLYEELGHVYEQEVMVRSLPQATAYAGVPVSSISPINDSREIINAVQSFNPDLIHIHYLGHDRDASGQADKLWYASFFRAAEALNIPVIENIAAATHPFLSSSVVKYVYVSHFVQKKFGIDYLPQCVIYPGCDQTHFTRKENSELPDDCIGFVCHLEKDLLLPNAIDPLMEVVRRRPETKVIIIGGGSLLEVFRNAVKKAGLESAFTFTGYVAYEDLPLYLEKLSLVVAPFSCESYGQAITGAMHMGLPVAGYQGGALPEIMAVDSLLASSEQAGELAHILLALLGDRERRLQTGTYNSLRARQRFSLEGMISRYAELYDDMFTFEKINTSSSSLLYEALHIT